jgi:hypothetical protein
MKRTRMRLGASAILLTFSLVGAVLIAGPASAASRTFMVKNDTGKTITLESVKPTKVYLGSSRGEENFQAPAYGMEFEGRPVAGTKVAPGLSQRFELKWGFTGGAPAYAALLTYKVEPSGDLLEFTIVTYTTVNESQCLICPNETQENRPAWTWHVCRAEGTNLTVLAPRGNTIPWSSYRPGCWSPTHP